MSDAADNAAPTPWTDAHLKQRYGEHTRVFVVRRYDGMDCAATFALSLEALCRQQQEALKHYTDVVESVNDPESFEPKVHDSGKPAREALAAFAAIDAANRAI